MDLTKVTEQLTEMAVAYAPKVALGLLTLWVGFRLIRHLVKMVVRAMEKNDVDVSLRKFLASLVSVGLKVLLVFSVAAMFGIKTTAFIAVLSALAFAIGMALQGSLGHFASGVMILLFKPYTVGDLIESNDHTGYVEEIQVFNTILRTLDNRRVIIPNGTVTSNPIVNISGPGEIRVDMTFGVGYGADIDEARSIIQGVADRCPQVLKDKTVDIFVSELADSSVNFAVRPWCKSEDYWDVYFYMHEHIKKELDKHAIEIPFPQMDVHMHQNGS